MTDDSRNMENELTPEEAAALVKYAHLHAKEEVRIYEALVPRSLRDFLWGLDVRDAREYYPWQRLPRRRLRTRAFSCGVNYCHSYRNLKLAVECLRMIPDAPYSRFALVRIFHHWMEVGPRYSQDELEADWITGEYDEAFEF